MQLPGPVRAAVGLIATAADEAKHLPDRAIELPMLAVSTVLQMSLRAQQRYAKLAARGDEALSGRSPSDEPPAWATFDDPLSAEELRAAGNGSGLPRDADSTGSDPLAHNTSELLDQLFGNADTPPPPVDLAERAARKAPAKRATRKTAVKKTTRKAAAKTAGRTTANTSAADGPPRRPSQGKAVSPPRHTAPSRFDAVGAGEAADEIEIEHDDDRGPDHDTDSSTDHAPDPRDSSRSEPSSDD